MVRRSRLAIELQCDLVTGDQRFDRALGGAYPFVHGLGRGPGRLADRSRQAPC